MIRDVKDLEVFKLAHSLVLTVYKLTESFPKEEGFGLIPQMRRSAYSIPMNLIEGSNRLNTKEYRRFVGIAKGSAGEISYQVMLAKDLGYVPEEVYSELKNKYEIVIKMLTNLAKSLGKKPNNCFLLTPSPVIITSIKKILDKLFGEWYRIKKF
jgi:four helix bundle protein